MKIDVKKTTSPREKAPVAKLGFGKYFSDHMFLMDFEGNEWKNARILPYGPLSLEPGACVLHYSQAFFEGMKAFRGSDGKIRFFRPRFHAERMHNAASRLCMPAFPTEYFVEALRELVKIDIDWVPDSRGASLYIRPTMIGTESFLGVRPANKYLFFIITNPVGAYYTEGFAPVKIWVEKEFIRAAPGGLGAVKAGANYAASMKAFVDAKKSGYAQVLWLDAVEKKNVEEVGTMNVFFRLKNEIVTPPLNGTILNGATRDSVIQMLSDWKLPVRERVISIDEVMNTHAKGELLEVFGTGTAAVISAVSELASKEKTIKINEGRVGELTQRLYDEITGIQYGERPDTHGWMETL